MSQRTERLHAILSRAAQRGRLVITGHDGADVDSVISCVLMQRLLAAWNIPCEIVLRAPDRQSRRVLMRFGVDITAMTGETKDGDQQILVDHHQSTRAGTVVACVDHHPTDYPPDIPYAQIEDSGACAVIVLRLLQEAGVSVTQEDERLAITALYLDTIALKSAKITKEEAAWGEREARRLSLDEAWLRREGMGLMDMSLPARELAMLGRKAYAFGERRVLSTYLQTDAMTQEKLEEILAVLRAELTRERAALWVFLVHDPVGMRSMQYNLTPDGEVQTIAYDYLTSRGKDVMPRVERAMRALSNGKDGRSIVSSGTDECAGGAACRQGKCTAGA
ncbi:MAG: DHH family phosphoesterase [Clostridiales bacterium]|nr:DHH family phosphoesterase [Clostridiales bacterium]